MSSFWQFFDSQMAIFRRVRFLPQTKDSAGLFNPSYLFYSKFLSFALSILNTYDLPMRDTPLWIYTCKNIKSTSLFTEVHMSFAGYQVTEDNKPAMGSKVNWPQSYWVTFLNCVKEVMLSYHSVLLLTNILLNYKMMLSLLLYLLLNHFIYSITEFFFMYYLSSAVCVCVCMYACLCDYSHIVQPRTLKTLA